MNIYLLVEGKRTERAIYPSWLSACLTGHNLTYEVDLLDGNSIFCFSAEGFPHILDQALPNALKDVRSVGAFDALIVVLDSDDLNYADLQERVARIVGANGGLPDRTELVTVIQRRCIESWLLGNRRFVPRVAQTHELIECKRFYNVTERCPERMAAPPEFAGSTSTYHVHYLRAAFRERGQTYSKARPGIAATHGYLLELRVRYAEGDLAGMAPFFGFLEKGANPNHGAISSDGGSRENQG